MSNFTDLIDVARTLPDDVLAKLLASARAEAGSAGAVLYSYADTDNALVTFTGQESVPHYGEYSFQFEGSKKDFSPSSRQWNMINWNCGQEEFAEDHPQIGLLTGRAVCTMSQTDVPGVGGRKQWTVDPTPALPKTFALPNHITTPEDALAYIKALPTPVTSGDGAGFGPHN